MGLFAIMHTPKPPGISIPIGHLDKVFHFCSYAVLAGLCVIHARRSGTRLTRSWYLKWLVIVALFAAADEALQPYVGRSADYLDWAADMVGVVTAFAVIGSKSRTGR